MNDPITDIARYGQHEQLRTIGIDQGLSPAEFEGLALDLAEWPLGHPCRNCGMLSINHPVAPPLSCEEWR